MRLVNCKTLQVEAFFSQEIPPYAILSHTWRDEEVGFEDMVGEAGKKKAGYQKIVQTCKLATKDGLNYAWIDTCCIDKRSSSELSEAINSMFQWYSEAVVCYVMLDDVRAANLVYELEKARWFTRGWTLQELLAPRDVKFFDREWSFILTRSDLEEYIARITGIDRDALRGHASVEFIRHTSVAKRLSWAAGRETTRKEDEAYCLLGLFGIQMAMLYGERDQAFQRLQEEIMKVSTDQTIFAWREDKLLEDVWKHKPGQAYGLLASSPRNFRRNANLQAMRGDEQSFQLTNRELSILAPVYRTNFSRDLHIAILACGEGHARIGIMLKALMPTDGARIRRIAHCAGFPLVKAETQSPTFVRALNVLLPMEDADLKRAQRMRINILRTPSLLQDQRLLEVHTYAENVKLDGIWYRSHGTTRISERPSVELEHGDNVQQYVCSFREDESCIFVQVCVSASGEESSKTNGQGSSEGDGEHSGLRRLAGRFTQFLVELIITRRYLLLVAFYCLRRAFSKFFPFFLVFPLTPFTQFIELWLLVILAGLAVSLHSSNCGVTLNRHCNNYSRTIQASSPIPRHEVRDPLSAWPTLSKGQTQTQALQVLGSTDRILSLSLAWYFKNGSESLVLKVIGLKLGRVERKIVTIIVITIKVIAFCAILATIAFLYCYQPFRDWLHLTAVVLTDLAKLLVQQGTRVLLMFVGCVVVFYWTKQFFVRTIMKIAQPVSYKKESQLSRYSDALVVLGLGCGTITGQSPGTAYMVLCPLFAIGIFAAFIDYYTTPSICNCILCRIHQMAKDALDEDYWETEQSSRRPVAEYILFLLERNIDERLVYIKL
ncbi:MAG: hypothetical protein M1821_000646 [Bathelium mastoideum]|nr:MAG: hypothetical protein M1821_000646 [Bathelium mastoideum]